MKGFAGVKQVLNELRSKQLPDSNLLVLTPVSSSEARVVVIPLIEIGK